MENHNVSISNILLERHGDKTLITVTISTPTMDIGIENKVSAPTTPCDNETPLETELTALKSFVLEQFFLIKKSTQEIKDPSLVATNSTYVAMLMEQNKYLKEGNKVKNSIIQSLTNQYNNILIVPRLITVIIIMIIIVILLLIITKIIIIIIIIIIITTIIYIKVIKIFVTPLTITILTILMITIMTVLVLKCFSQ